MASFLHVAKFGGVGGTLTLVAARLALSAQRERFFCRVPSTNHLRFAQCREPA
jgi:hypothetical protein